MTETKIYVGLNDSETRVQMYDTEKYISILKDVCRNYHVGFSVSAGQGGYFFEDGSYVQETTLVLSLIDADVDTVNEIAKDLIYSSISWIMVTSFSLTGLGTLYSFPFSTK